MKKKQTGFTLIELLIVVAIIAILASIAIPNFLTAQTRAKVSKCRAEMHSLATGLESYAVDYNTYPPAWFSQSGFGIGWQTPDYMPPYLLRMTRLTTPVAYITKVPMDVFNPLKDRTMTDWSENHMGSYIYFTSYTEDIIHLYSGGVFPSPNWSEENGEAKWRLASYGPARKRFISGSNFTREDKIGIVNYLYDPTNGTISNGYICRYGP